MKTTTQIAATRSEIGQAAPHRTLSAWIILGQASDRAIDYLADEMDCELARAERARREAL